MDTSDLLLWSALLPWFDLPLLQALTGCTEAEAAAFLAALPCVEAGPGAGRYRLCAAQRTEGVARLRAAGSAQEIAMHRRAFDLFCQRLVAAPAARRQLEDEEGCFHHLDQLFFILNVDRAWRTLGRLVKQAAATRPLYPPHQQLLQLLRGYVCFNLRHYRKGKKRLKRLLRLPGLSVALRLRALNGLGLLHMYQSHYDEALTHFQAVVALSQEQVPPDTTYQGVALINMGMIHNDLGRFEEAIQLTEQSLALFRATNDERRISYALYELGNNALFLGRWEQAHHYFEEGAGLAQKLDQPGRLAYMLWGQGFLHHVMDRIEQSEAAYQRALAIAEAAGRNAPTLTADILWHLGFLYFTQGRLTEALAAYDRALPLVAGSHWLSVIRYHKGNVLRALGCAAEAMDTYELAIETFEELRSATRIETTKLGLLSTIQPLYEAMVLLCLEQGENAKAFHYMERARSRAFLDLLAPADAAQAAASPVQVATLAEVQAGLPEQALIAEYFVIGTIPSTESMVRRLVEEQRPISPHLRATPQGFVFVITHDAFSVLPLPNFDPDTDVHTTGELSHRTLLSLHHRRPHHLYRTLIQPIETWLEGKQLLYLIPHGPLHHVPFTALHMTEGRYLLDHTRPPLAFVPSATTLLRTCRNATSTTGKFFALGYNGSGEKKLRYAESEAHLLAHLMGGKAWTGSEAKQQRLLGEAESLQWLHISGHGEYNPHTPLDSVLHIGEGDSLSARTIMEQARLNGAVVSLSACTSGLSQVMPGDELLGLPRAFLHAGASAVLCTLWQADDLAALMIMGHVYRALQRNTPPALALRDAQLALREMTGYALLKSVLRWQYAYQGQMQELTALRIAPDKLGQPFFDEASQWALFLLLGRAH